MSQKLFKTSTGLEINGVKIFYGLGTPTDQPQLPLIENAFYYDGAAGVFYLYTGGEWTVRGGGEAKYIYFDNSVAQIPGSPEPQTVQDVLDILIGLLDQIGDVDVQYLETVVADHESRLNSLTAADVFYDNTGGAFDGSPAPANVQQAVDDIQLRLRTIEISGAPAATWQYKNADFEVEFGGHYIVDTSAGSVTAMLPEALTNQFEAHFRDAAGTWGDVGFEFYVQSFVSAESPPTYATYKIVGEDPTLLSPPVAILIVDVAYTDLHLSYDATNNNVVI